MDYNVAIQELIETIETALKRNIKELEFSCAISSNMCLQVSPVKPVREDTNFYVPISQIKKVETVYQN